VLALIRGGRSMAGKSPLTASIEHTLDAAIHTAVVDLNTERNRDLLGKQ
jgi:hypothetical protein